MKVFVVDVAKCNGCYGCQLACKDEHVDNDWTPYAKPQPDTGHFWMKMTEKVHGQVPKVKLEYVAKPCMHCDDATCIKVARDGAVYKREDGLVIIDPEKAKGQHQIVEACPYGAVFWNDKLQIPQKCTGCAHLVDEGKTPRCVDACATGAIQFGDESDFADLIARAEVMLPELGTRPRVYYLNLPKLFVAGSVYDPVEDECIIGARVTLTCSAGQVMQTETDEFGDFWFRRLEPGAYSIKIEKDGFKPYAGAAFEVRESINVGDIALEK